jgi:hypothetical protein
MGATLGGRGAAEVLVEAVDAEREGATSGFCGDATRGGVGSGAIEPPVGEMGDAAAGEGSGAATEGEGWPPRPGGGAEAVALADGPGGVGALAGVGAGVGVGAGPLGDLTSLAMLGDGSGGAGAVTGAEETDVVEGGGARAAAAAEA